MDPDAALAQLLAAVADLREAEKDPDLCFNGAHMAACADDIARNVEALDEWLAGGGFRPRRWAVA